MSQAAAALGTAAQAIDNLSAMLSQQTQQAQQQFATQQGQIQNLQNLLAAAEAKAATPAAEAKAATPAASASSVSPSNVLASAVGASAGASAAPSGTVPSGAGRVSVPSGTLNGYSVPPTTITSKLASVIAALPSGPSASTSGTIPLSSWQAAWSKLSAAGKNPTISTNPATGAVTVSAAGVAPQTFHPR